MNPTDKKSMWVAGVDGCKRGWVVALSNLDVNDQLVHIRVVEQFRDL